MKIKISLIVVGLLCVSSLNGTETIYDGTASLIKSTEGQKTKKWTYNGQNYWGWGMHQDEVDMHHHKNKNSAVSIQWIYNKSTCKFIEITSSKTIKVLIKSKGWADTKATTYDTKLSGNPITIPSVSNSYDTVFIITKYPVVKTNPSTPTQIIAKCKGSLDTQNTPQRTSDTSLPIINDRTLMGNASVISIAGTNTIEKVFGVTQDEGITLENKRGVMAFQVLSSDKCRSVTIYGTKDRYGVINNIKLDSILVKGWDEPLWGQPIDCKNLPCTIKLPSVDKKEQYTLIQVRTNSATREQSIGAICKDAEASRVKKFTLNNKKDSSLSHPTNCQFYDVRRKEADGTDNWFYKYVTALCSAGIIKGYHDGKAVQNGKAEFGPGNKAKGVELAKVVHYANNQNKMSALIKEKGWITASREMANKYGFGYVTYKDTITRGLALRYVIKVFWDKDITDDYKAGQFLKERDIIHGEGDNEIIDSNYLNKTLNRVEMAKIVFRSATMSATDNAVERKLSYIRHISNEDTTVLDTGISKGEDNTNSTDSEPLKSENIPEPQIKNPPMKIDTNPNKDREKENERIDDNIEELEQNGSPFITYNSTDPLSAILNILGLLKTKVYKFEEKSIEEVENELNAQHLNNPTESNFTKGDLIFITTSNGQRTVGLFTKNKKILLITGVKTADDRGVNSLSISEIKKAGGIINSKVSSDEIYEKVKEVRGKIKTN